MHRCVIITGGRLDEVFASEFLEKYQPEFLIAADKGLAFCEHTNHIPTQIVGDFDTLGTKLFPKYESMGIPIRKYNPVKDATDTEIALQLAVDLGAEEIYLLGGSEGNRLDHLFGNVQSMIPIQKQGISCYMLDAHNRIRILTESVKLRKEELYGTYLSLVPLTTVVRGVHLKGFRYPLEDYEFQVQSSGSLGISNELEEETGSISFLEGILLMVESSD